MYTFTYIHLYYDQLHNCWHLCIDYPGLKVVWVCESKQSQLDVKVTILASLARCSKLTRYNHGWPNTNILWISISLCLIKMAAGIDQGKMTYKLSMLHSFSFKEVPKNQCRNCDTQTAKAEPLYRKEMWSWKSRTFFPLIGIISLCKD